MSFSLRSTLQQFYKAQRHYSDSAYNAAAAKWQIRGIPKPKSILEDDDAEVDLSEDNEAVNGVNPNAVPIHLRRPSGKPTPQLHKLHRESIRKEFPNGWNPPKKISREAMDALRQLHKLNPEQFTTGVLAAQFKISPEAVRRILKGRWEPSAEKRTKAAIKERQQRELSLKERENKEHLETERVRELQYIRRKDQYFDQKARSLPRKGISIEDNFTFQ